MTTDDTDWVKMKRLLFYSLVFYTAMMLLGCIESRQNEVVVVEKTKTYHTDKCLRVNMANIKWMRREEVKAMNFKACPGCQPDKGLAGQSDRQN